LPLIRAELQRWRLPRPGPLIHDLSQVLYLPFDHDDGSYARDRSGYNNHSTIYGATLATGKIGMARSFDGVDDYVKVPHSSSLNITETITITLWMKPASDPDTWTIPIGLMWKGDRYTLSLWFWEGNHNLYFDSPEATIRINAYPSAGWEADTWYFIGITYDKNTGALNMWINDELTKGYGTGNLNTNTLNLEVGKGRGYPFPGIIDEVHIYNRALSAAEIARLMYLRGI